MLPGAADRIEVARTRLSCDLTHQPSCFPPDAVLCPPQALAQAIKEAKEQHPDMSVTKVVVHQETEISEE